nr:coiled-coil domain-containing protein 63-like [Leptinotarsa decemlineata]
MITIAEEELSRLRRQLRIMEDDRIAFLDETGSKLEKQRKIIEMLKKEKEKVSEDIKVSTCTNQRRNDKKLGKNIHKLLEDFQKLVICVKNEKEQLKELDVQMRKMEGDIKNLRPKSAVTDQHYQNRLMSGQKSIKILQNRLDNSIKRFCCILTENKKLREEIDHLLKERSHFNEIWEALLKDISGGKKFMAELIEQATVAFDQREEWCSKLVALKKRAQNDFLAHSEEMREIQRKLDHDLTLKEFLNVKGQRRILKDLEEKERKKKESEIQSLENQLDVYEKTMEKIQRFCEEDDVQRIASQFLKREEENFALFNYVNELNHEIEQLNSGILEMEEKIDEQVEIGKIRATERQANLNLLQADLDESVKQTIKDEENAKKAESELIMVLQGIENIFTMLNCDRGPILDLLGENSSINVYNVNIFLGTIEKKVSALITRVYFDEKAMLTQSKRFHRENLVRLIN